MIVLILVSTSSRLHDELGAGQPLLSMRLFCEFLIKVKLDHPLPALTYAWRYTRVHPFS